MDWWIIGDPALTNELIAGGAQSPTSLEAPLIRIFKQKEGWQNIFGLCVQRRSGKKIFTVPHLPPSNPLSCPTFHRLTPWL